MDSRRLWAATGIMTFSSKLPDCPAIAMVVSLPITCAQTIVADSAITGFTLPGMMELPGWTSGSAISPMPARGPEPSQRRSLQIFIKLTATVLSAPEALTTASMVLCDWKWLSVSEKGIPVRFRRVWR